MLKLHEPTPDIKKKVLRKFSNTLNHCLTVFGIPIELRKKANISSDMITLEQVVNLTHLAEQVIHFDVAGEFVELGCHKGNSAIQIQAIIEKLNSNKKLYLFDKFNMTYDTVTNIKHALIENFNYAKLQLPVIYEGFFHQTLPLNLPNEICFAHIDCGDGGDPHAHKELIKYCLENIYPRLSKNGVCILMDYHDVDKTIKGANVNSGVKLACDEFFKDKKESVEVLYGNDFSHGYFRKNYNSNK